MERTAPPRITALRRTLRDLAGRRAAAGPGRRSRRGLERSRAHTVAFTDPDAAIAAVRRLGALGFVVSDAYTPFPVHGMDEALGLRPTRLPLATLVGGVAGGSLALSFMIWTHAYDWPLNIGGKSDLSLPGIIPVAFELTVLLAAFATVSALFLRGRLWPRLRGETAPGQPHPAVTDDRFVLVVEERDGSFDRARFRAACADLGAAAVTEDWKVL